MPVAQFRFPLRKATPASRADLENKAQLLLVMLWKNGQVEGLPVLAWDGKAWVAWTRVPAADFFDDRYATPWVRTEIQDLARRGATPRVRIIGDERPLRSPSWRSVGSFALMPDTMENQSPVLRGDGRGTLPPYVLPLDTTERQDLMIWAEDYLRAWHLWIASAGLEKAAYREMVDPSRPLLRKGAEFTALIEERTGRPTYLFVKHVYGRAGEERSRRCPGCGGRWSRPKARHPWMPYEGALFCDPCRFVSEVASTFDEPVMARMGVFRGGRATAPAGVRRSTPRPAR